MLRFLKPLRPALWVASYIGIQLTELGAATNRVYISVSNEDRIAVFDQNEQTGYLNHINDISILGSPKTLELSPDNQYLFASISKLGKTASYRLDSKNGQGTLLSESDTGAHASFYQIDKSGRYLISAYFSLGKIMVHGVKNGRLSKNPLQVIETDERAHSAVLDPSNRFLFVPHTRPNTIYQFHFDSKTRTLTPNDVPYLQRTETAGPRHLRFNSTGNYAYCSDEQGGSISTYQLNQQNGRLALIQSLATLPAEYEGKNATSDVQLHPTGNFVYIANRGHDSLAAYAIDKPSGKLSFIDRVPCEPATRSFALSKDGRFLYAAGTQSGKLAIYSVDEDTGRLSKLDSLNIGKNLWWVLFVEKE